MDEKRFRYIFEEGRHTCYNCHHYGHSRAKKKCGCFRSPDANDIDSAIDITNRSGRCELFKDDRPPVRNDSYTSVDSINIYG